MNNKKKIKIQNIAILIENIEYGGTTTHLINLINSSKYKFVKFFIITNKNNKAIIVFCLLVVKKLRNYLL